MSGPEPDPSLPVSPDAVPSPDYARWREVMHRDQAAHEAAEAAPVHKAVVATDQLSTIGHIGRYALKYQIGEGGLGRVYAAHDPLLSRLIAIKTLNVEISADERDSFNELFLNEARAAGGLSHPHIVTVFDAGVSEQGPYIAMELLRGRDLRQLRQEGWRPTPMQAALVVRRVADALAYAHSKGVVHRDIKPANIFMIGRTQPRVLDFGIARVAHQRDVQGAGEMIAGSPYYMSPEQIRHDAVDRRTDVFSLGVVLYELLTDVRPFRGSSLAEITSAVLEVEPHPANTLDPNVPKALADIAARAMQKDRNDRFSSARSLSRELRRWLEEHPQQESETPEAPPAQKRTFAWAGASAGIAALALAGGAWWWLDSNGDDSNTHLQAAAPQASAAYAAAPMASEPLVAAPAAADAASVPPPGDAALAAAAPLPELAPSAGQALVAAALVPDPAPSAVEQIALATTSDVAAGRPLLPAELPLVNVAQPTKPARTRATEATAQSAKPPRATPKESRKDAVKEVPKDTPKEAPKETPKERRAREKAEQGTSSDQVVFNGTLRIAVTPWGNVEVDGRAVGTAPPLNELNLPEGRHTVTIRNGEFPPFSTTVNVMPGQSVNVKHRFGS